jgi:hypothetical protein
MVVPAVRQFHEAFGEVKLMLVLPVSSMEMSMWTPSGRWLKHFPSLAAFLDPAFFVVV